jgi:hypothetical protein
MLLRFAGFSDKLKLPENILDLFNNPVGYLPSKAWLPTFGWLQVLQETLRVSMLRILLFLSNSTSYL